MTDTSLSEAMKEAYASAPDDEVILLTIEMRHPSFTEPLRVVRNHVALTGTLETTAPANPGEAVEFLPYAFDLNLPEVTETGRPEIRIAIENISREIVAALEAAVQTVHRIEVTYRAWLLSDTTCPQNDPPMTMVVTNVTATAKTVEMTAGFTDLTKLAYPKKKYTLEQFPSLASNT